MSIQSITEGWLDADACRRSRDRPFQQARRQTRPLALQAAVMTHSLSCSLACLAASTPSPPEPSHIAHNICIFVSAHRVQRGNAAHSFHAVLHQVPFPHLLLATRIPSRAPVSSFHIVHYASALVRALPVARLHVHGAYLTRLASAKLQLAPWPARARLRHLFLSLLFITIRALLQTWPSCFQTFLALLHLARARREFFLALFFTPHPPHMCDPLWIFLHGAHPSNLTPVANPATSLTCVYRDMSRQDVKMPNCRRVCKGFLRRVSLAPNRFPTDGSWILEYTY